MTIEPSLAAPDDARQAAVDRVIRSFSDAEMALRDLVQSAGKLRSSADALDSASSEMAASREAIAGVTTTVIDMSEAVRTLATRLVAIAEQLQGLDPARLWGEMERAATQASDRHERTLLATGEALDSITAQTTAQADQTRAVVRDEAASVSLRIVEAADRVAQTAVSALSETSALVSEARVDARVAVAESEARLVEADAATRDALSAALVRTQRRVTQLMVVAIVGGLMSIGAVGLLLARY